MIILSGASGVFKRVQFLSTHESSRRNNIALYPHSYGQISGNRPSQICPQGNLLILTSIFKHDIPLQIVSRLMQIAQNHTSSSEEALFGHLSDDN